MSKKYYLPIFALVMTLLLPDLWMYPGTDYGVYFNNGRLLSQGWVPYLDYWDHKTPGIFIYLSIWQSIFGSSWWSAKASLFLIYALWGLSLHTFTRSIVARQSVIPLLVSLTGVYLVLRLGLDPARNGAILVLSTSIELCSLSFLLRWNNDVAKVSNSDLFKTGILSGMLAGFAFMVRQTSVVSPIVLMVLLIRNVRRDRTTRIWRGVVYYAVGGIVPVLTFLIAILSVGADVRTFLFDVVAYNRVYARYYLCAALVKQWFLLFLAQFEWIALPIIGSVYLIHGRKERYEEQSNGMLRNVGFVCLCSAIAIILTILSIKPQKYYFIQCLPYLIIISIIVASFWFESRRLSRSIIFKFGGAVIVLLFILNIGLMTREDLRGFQNVYETARAHHFRVDEYPDQRISREIRTMLGRVENKKIFVFGNRAWIYVFTRTSSPNAFTYDVGMFKKGYLTREQFDVVMAALEADPPGVIVYWSSRPEKESGFYDTSFVETFERFVAMRYTMEYEEAFEKVWPYYFTQPIYLYLLKSAK